MPVGCQHLQMVRQLFGIGKVVNGNDGVIWHIQIGEYPSGKHHRHNQLFDIPELLRHVILAHRILKGQIEEMLICKKEVGLGSIVFVSN
jgi:hypothetical protein